MERIQTEQQYRDLINSDGMTVIKFDTTWCPDCKTWIGLSVTLWISTPTKRSMHWMQKSSSLLPKRTVYAAFQACWCSRMVKACTSAQQMGKNACTNFRVSGDP